MMLAYTVRTASSKAASRSSMLPALARNTDSYLPAKAFPQPSSRIEEERTMMGSWP